MKFATKRSLATLPLIAALVACGGGDDKESVGTVDTSSGSGGLGGGSSSGGGHGTTSTPGSVTGTTGNTTETTVGKVDAALLKGAALRYVMVSTKLQVIGSIATLEQLPDGSVVSLNGNLLTGSDRSVLNLAGNSSWAQGRWAKGNALVSGKSSVLGAARNDAIHYVVYSAPKPYPATGNFTCDSGTFTAPNVVDAGTGDAFGTASGKATLSFSNGMPFLGIAVTATAGARQATVATESLRGIPGDGTIFAGGFDMVFGSDRHDGFMLTIGDGGNGKYRIVAGYQVTHKGASYLGVASFLCGP